MRPSKKTRLHRNKVRDGRGYWNNLESFVARHSEAGFSHGICPDCAERHYPGLNLYEDDLFSRA